MSCALFCKVLEMKGLEGGFGANECEDLRDWDGGMGRE